MPYSYFDPTDKQVYDIDIDETTSPEEFTFKLAEAKLKRRQTSDPWANLGQEQAQMKTPWDEFKEGISTIGRPIQSRGFGPLTPAIKWAQTPIEPLKQATEYLGDKFAQLPSSARDTIDAMPVVGLLPSMMDMPARIGASNIPLPSFNLKDNLKKSTYRGEFPLDINWSSPQATPEDQIEAEREGIRAGAEGAASQLTPLNLAMSFAGASGEVFPAVAPFINPINKVLGGVQVASGVERIAESEGNVGEIGSGLFETAMGGIMLLPHIPGVAPRKLGNVYEALKSGELEELDNLLKRAQAGKTGELDLARLNELEGKVSVQDVNASEQPPDRFDAEEARKQQWYVNRTGNITAYQRFQNVLETTLERIKPHAIKTLSDPTIANVKIKSNPGLGTYYDVDSQTIYIDPRGLGGYGKSQIERLTEIMLHELAHNNYLHQFGGQNTTRIQFEEFLVKTYGKDSSGILEDYNDALAKGLGSPQLNDVVYWISNHPDYTAQFPLGKVPSSGAHTIKVDPEVARTFETSLPGEGIAETWGGYQEHKTLGLGERAKFSAENAGFYNNFQALQNNPDIVDIMNQVHKNFDPDLLSAYPKESNIPILRKLRDVTTAAPEINLLSKQYIGKPDKSWVTRTDQSRDPSKKLFNAPEDERNPVEIFNRHRLQKNEVLNEAYLDIVRHMPDEIFESLVKQNPKIADWLREQRSSKPPNRLLNAEEPSESDIIEDLVKAHRPEALPEETKPPRVAQVTSDTGVLSVAFHKSSGAVSPESLKAMMQKEFPDHSIDVEPLKAGLGRSEDLDLYKVTLWDKSNRLDHAAADKAQELFGGRMFREAPAQLPEVEPKQIEAPKTTPEDLVTETPEPEAKVTWQDFAEARTGMPLKQIQKEWRAYRAKGTVQGGLGTVPPGEPGMIAPNGPVGTVPPGKGTVLGPSGKGPQIPEGPPPQKLSLWRKIVSSNLKNVKRISPKVHGRLVRFVDEWEKPAANFIALRRKLTEGITSAEDREIVDILDGKLTYDEASSPRIKEIALDLRDISEDIFRRAEEVGLKVEHRENHFPHMFQKDIDTPVKMAGGKIYQEQGLDLIDPNLELPRQTNRQDYIRKLEALDIYYNRTLRRISQVKNLGKTWGQVFGKEVVGNEATKQYMKTAVRQIAGMQEPKWYRKYLGGARKVQALSDLGLAAIYQPGQLANTSAYGGVLRSVRSMKRISSKSSYNEQFFKALRSGALNPDIQIELMGPQSVVASKLKDFMYGIPTMDKFMRVHAYTVGETLYNEAKAGSKSALRTLSELDPKFKHGVKYHTAEDVGKFLADKGQFRVSAGHQPQWANTDLGKMMWQYKGFMYQHGLFVKDLFKTAASGNVKPLARFLATGAVLGEGIADVRELIKGRPLNPSERDQPWDEDTWDQNLLAIVRNKRIGWGHPGLRLLQNYAMLGGAGILQAYMEASAGRGRTLAKVVGGPVAANIEDLAERTLSGDVEGVAKWGIEQAPVYGYDASEYLFPKKKGKGPKSSAKGVR